MALILSLFLPVAEAQTPGQDQVRPSGPRQQLATIIFSGLGGAVLGLSTLSFYGRPQDRLSNIAVGFAVGIIGGTIFTTYKTARRPYDDIAPINGADANFLEGGRDRMLGQKNFTPMLGWTWEY